MSLAVRPYFSEDERFLVVDRVDAVAGDDFGAELATHRVRRKSEHVHLDVRSQLPVRQELTGNDLQPTTDLKTFLLLFIRHILTFLTFF